ncbi:uncharacterized protein [Anabrus simplex]|uniref:uncharacterized protein n=1 Tax=Anabrus simplex TaxID=316456 RepID=UPI0034DCD733
MADDKEKKDEQRRKSAWAQVEIRQQAMEKKQPPTPAVRRPILADAPQQDSLNTEFVYYSATLKNLAPALTSDKQRRMVVPWLDKLFGPEYHSTHLRAKRNRYLLKMTLMLMNDEVIGTFTTAPPTGALPDLPREAIDASHVAEWEQDCMWSDTVAGLPPQVKHMPCGLHEECPTVQEKTHKVLDEEFQLYLYLARPYASLLTNPEDKTKAATWLQVLCTVQKDACPVLKGIRNDYIQALLGCVHDLRVSGPFESYPPWGPLRPLAEAARFAAEKKPVLTDPTSPAADNFLRTQPLPENGAFCYIVVTGDLQGEDKQPPIPDLRNVGPY